MQQEWHRLLLANAPGEQLPLLRKFVCGDAGLHENQRQRAVKIAGKVLGALYRERPFSQGTQVVSELGWWYFVLQAKKRQVSS